MIGKLRGLEFLCLLMQHFQKTHSRPRPHTAPHFPDFYPSTPASTSQGSSQSDALLDGLELPPTQLHNRQMSFWEVTVFDL
ncbi:hypothetical protein F5146DRAFT_1038408 [Armillaria mellea]|nr:hypothetical protein F5146DRAFT_1038408 [Armillaria mellea]